MNLVEFGEPERYEIMRRSLNQTVGRMTSAVKIPNKCLESNWKLPQCKDVPGNSLVRLSPSKMINSTQYDCIHQKEISYILMVQNEKEEWLLRETNMCREVIQCSTYI